MLEVELKIEDKKIKILEKLQGFIGNNYQNNENTVDYLTYNPVVLNLQRENFGVIPESKESEKDKEKDHLVHDQDDDVICLD